MGHHYVPQYYLRGFSLDANSLWVFDKKERRAFETQAKSIAHETDFYSEDVERYLADKVEDPANAVLDRIRDRAPLARRDKEVLGAYMVCMMKRVPRAKEQMRDRAPSVAEELGKEYDQELQAATQQQPERRELLEGVRARVQEILDKWSADPPKDVWLANLPPGTTPRAVAALAQMTWRFLLYDRSPAFLTSDNPVFYFPHIGIGRPESEVTFPISSNIVLWATWRSDLREGYFSTRQSVVTEVNRRTASIATRYAFHAINESWVLGLLSKSNWRLNRLS